MDKPRVLILGIGNLLWADEGFGVRAVEHLYRHYACGSEVKLLDGGTQGLYLVQHVREARILVVFDAVDYGLEPGTLKLVTGDEVPSFMGAKKMSLHQTGFQEVLASAQLLGDYPEHLLLIGVQPVQLEDYGGSLHPVVKRQIAPAVEAAVSYLAGLGVCLERRGTPLPEEATLGQSELVMSRYESGRPTPDQACRFGDPRILASAFTNPSPSD